MKRSEYTTISYFPGCSMATTARENNDSLKVFCRLNGIVLEDIEDWNCCGSSSAHMVDDEVAISLPARNLALAPRGRPVLAACPNCYLRLREAHVEIMQNPGLRHAFEKRWKKPFDPDLKIISFFELLSDMTDQGAFSGRQESLHGLVFAPYYGCMLAMPPKLRGKDERNPSGLMEKVLSGLGARPVRWMHRSRCCGTFLSVTRPLVASKSVAAIISGAEDAGAECIVTACSMCHLNLEIRSPRPCRIPILHFSEVLSLAAGIGSRMGWFSRHIIDPRPVLRARRLIP